MALVTIGMPVYNGANYIAEALESVLSQTFADFELIISDNGSTDRTEDICRAFADRDARVRYVRNERNRGAAWNYNRTFALSDSLYFKWASHDDLCAPQFLEKCVSVLNSRGPQAVLCYPRTLLIDAAGHVTEHYLDNMDLAFAGPVKRLHHVLKYLDRCNCVFGLMRSDALRRTRLIGDFVTSDVVLVRELALLGQFHEIAEPLFFRRIHQEQYAAAHTTDQQRMRWFDPHARKPRWSATNRVFMESVASSLRLPLATHVRIASVLLLTITFCRTRLNRICHRTTRGLGKLSWRWAEPAGHSEQNDTHEGTGPPAASPTSS
jgi:glycosyltransferase involved in cell wall biosynthesis